MTRAGKKYVKNVALLWTASLAVFLLAYFLVLVPQRQNRDRLSAELAQKEQQRRSARDYEARQAEGAPAQEIQQLHERFNDFVFDFQNTGDLTFAISEIAKDKQVPSLANIHVGERAEPAVADCRRIAESTIDISFKADFNQFLNLVNALERHRPVVFVDTFTITRSRQGDSGHPVEMKLAVFLTSQQEQTASGTTMVVTGAAGL